MGDWTAVIQGCGVHHNHNNDGDADRIVGEAVQKLRSVGQNIKVATFSHGAQEEFLPLPSVEDCGKRAYDMYMTLVLEDGVKVPPYDTLSGKEKNAWNAAGACTREL